MKQSDLVPRNILVPFILVTSLFFAWGLANNMTDTLLAAFKRRMSMTDFQTSWVQMAFYTAYFCLALPAAICIKKYTYKTGIILGLILFIVGGLGFYPAGQTMQYGHFLIALYILAGEPDEAYQMYMQNNLVQDANRIAQQYTISRNVANVQQKSSSPSKSVGNLKEAMNLESAGDYDAAIEK